MPLGDVVLKAGDSEAVLGAVAAATAKRASLCPSGEAGSVDVAFRAGGVHRTRRVQVYVECQPSYQITVEISPSFEATGSVRLR